MNIAKYKIPKKVDKHLSFLANYNTPENTEMPSVENLVANFMPYAKKDIDLSNAKNTTQLVFELSSIMEHPDVKGKNICLKLGSLDLKQSQIASNDLQNDMNNRTQSNLADAKLLEALNKNE